MKRYEVKFLIRNEEQIKGNEPYADDFEEMYVAEENEEKAIEQAKDTLLDMLRDNSYYRIETTDDGYQLIDDDEIFMDYTLFSCKEIVEKAEIRCYSANATIFTDSGTMEIYYDTDSICPENYADVKDYLDELKSEIIEKLGEIENIDDIMAKIEIEVDPLFTIKTEKYVVITQKRGDMWEKEFDTKDDAIAEAEYQWNHLTDSEKKTNIIEVVKMINNNIEEIILQKG